MTTRNYPLSSPQREIWFEQSAYPDVPLYNLGGYTRLEGTIAPVLFEQAVQVLVKRHDALRIRLTGSDKDGMPLQRFAEYSAVEVPFYDLSEQVDPHQAALKWMKQAFVQPFDLQSDHPLFCYALIEVHDQLFYWFQTYHHLIMDSWGIALLTKELGNIYTTLTRGKPVHGTNEFSYLSFIKDDRHYIDSPKYDHDHQYWLSKYTDMPEPLFTPRFSGQFGTSLPASQCHSVDLPRSLYDRVIMFTKQQGVSIFHLILGVFYVYFTRTRQRDDLAVGLPILNRSNAPFKQTVDLFTKVSPVWFRLGRQLSFAELLQAIKDELIENSEDHYERFPICDLNHSISQHQTTKKQLFDLKLSYQNYDYTSTFDTVPAETHFLSNDIEQSPLHIYIREFYANKPVTLDFFYSLAYFKAGEIERIQAGLVHLLESVIERAEQSVATLPLLTETEIAQLKIWNATETDYPKNQTVVELFESQVQRTPDNIAVAFEKQCLTYRELNDQANRLAHYLIDLRDDQGRALLKTNPDTGTPLIGLCLERSLEMIIGLLGILKAGAAYVPIDPDYPQSRLAFMLEDSRVPVLVTHSALLERLPEHKAHLVCMNSDHAAIEAFHASPQPTRATPDDLAYVLYTSGSTGRPKGVMIEHRALCNFLHDMGARVLAVPDIKVLAITTLSFDIAALELYLPLIHGAQIVLIGRAIAADGERLQQIMASEAVQLMQATPSTWQLLLNSGWQQKTPLTVLCGGEALSSDLAKQLSRQSKAFWNVYGPTETTIWSSAHLVTKHPNCPCAIGRPIANTRIYILDDDHQPLPPGISGELCIGGYGLARGYLNRPELTKEKFVEVELFGKTERIYKTGDLARWLPDGNLEYLGRIDQQIKLRGFRIELGEIEAVLSQYPAVREAVVIAREESDDEKRLVAYVLPEKQSVESHTSSESQAEQVKQWQHIWDATYLQPALTLEPTFNIVGWKDSYTGLPIPPDQMRKWVDYTVERILCWQPKRVLEIGCGTGMLLFQIAPHCSSYVGTDISRQALHYIEQYKEQMGGLNQVTLLERRADVFSGWEPNTFDTVIINSVIQYFPNVEYLLTVLEGALSVVAPGGIIFVGDVRHLRLLKTLHAAVELHRAPASLSREKLRQRIQNSVSKEQELLIDHALFYALLQHFPKISHVDIQLKRGHYQNEITQFRYDVILHVGKETLSTGKQQKLDWQQNQLTLSKIRQILVESQPEILCISSVPNARVLKEVKLLDQLASYDGPATVGELRKVLSAESGVDPEQWWALSNQLPYMIYVNWSGNEAKECVDVVCQRSPSTPRSNSLLPISIHNRPTKSWAAYANNPLQGKVAHWLEPKLRAHLAARLPDYMMPTAFVMLDTIPLTPNGKLDRSALPAPSPTRPQLETALVMPQSETEQLLATIWQEALQLETVGIHDNFFELGGHSLLLTLVHNKLVPIFGQKLLIVDMFQHPTIHTLAKYLSQFSTSGQTSNQQPTLKPRIRRRTRKTKLTHEIKDTDIAIIGMSCRFPGANNLDTFWQNLRDGVESISFFSDEELEISDPRLLSHPHYVKACPILSEVELFDASFFDYSTKEAEIMDPQQRLFLECAWEAFENAGVVPKMYEGLVGVYAGSGMNSYLINNIHPNRDFSPNRTFLDSASDLQVRLGNDKDHIATRISYKLNLKGPSVNVQTACSTALTAVHLACQGLQTGECDIALAGCMNIILPQKTGYLYQEDMIFSPDGHCRAFDAKAQGTLFGNGGGAVILKLLSEAIADGDDIYAVIKGSAVNNDGSLKVGYSAPSVDGQASVIFDALSVAEIDASTISYVEAHGTGTSLGDPIEIAALTQAFHANTNKESLVRNTCALGSVKTNLGHITEAAGLAGLIKTLLALQAQLIPPTLHFTEPNPKIDFESGPFYVNTELSEWKTNGFPRRAGVSAFGMGGTNAHLVLEEAPRREKLRGEKEGNGASSLVAERSYHLLTLSAKSDKALQELSQRYETYLDLHPDISLAELCYTTNTGRQHFSHRLAVVSSSTAQLREQLVAFLQGTPQTADVIKGQVNSRHSPKKSLPSGQSLSKGKVIAFLFTGQGSQYVDMGRTLYETQPLFREVLEKCDDILTPLLGHSLLKLLYSPEEPNECSLLDQTAYTQPTLFAIEYALAELWKSWGIEPDVVMGHSVGEYVAACVAGVFSLEEGLKLIAERGRLVQALPPGGEMVAVMASEAQVANAIRSAGYAQDLSHQSKVSIAAINGPESIVISGQQSAVRAVSAALEVQGVKTKYLKVSHAFHSPLMEPMLDAFHTVAQQIYFSTPQLKLISNVTGTVATEQVATPEYWCRHIREPVQFAAGMASLAQQGVNMFVEIGPKPALLGMGHQCLPDSDGLWLPSLHPKRDDWQQLLTSLASAYVHGVDISWSDLGQEYAKKCQRLHLPTYPFQRKRYWIEPATTRSPLLEWREQSHPLLGQRLHLAGTSEIRFESQISRKALSFLADSDIVLPMTAYLEMAIAAGTKIFKSNQITVEDVFSQQPLFLLEHEVTTLQFVLKPALHSANERTNQHNSAIAASNPQTARWANFEIYSLTHQNDEPVWMLHTVGILRQGEQGVAPQTEYSLTRLQNLAVLQNQCDEVLLPVNLFYQQAGAYGFEYGLNLQGIKQLWISKEQENMSQHPTDTASHQSALGRICLPEELLQHDYQFHPALLDACLQVSVAAFLHESKSFGDGEQSNTYIPMSVDQLTLFIPAFKLRELYNTGTQSLWSHAQICSTSNQELLTADVHIFDESGKPVALVAGFSMKRTTRDALQPHTGELLHSIVTSPIEKPDQADLLQKLTNTPVKERWNLFATEVRVVVGQVLGTESSADSTEWLALQQGFFDYGMDSFTSIELRNRLQSRLGCALPTTLAFKYSTVESLVNYLASEVLSLEFTLQPEVEPQNAPANNDDAMERKVHELSESEAEAWLLKELQAMD